MYNFRKKEIVFFELVNKKNKLKGTLFYRVPFLYEKRYGKQLVFLLYKINIIMEIIKKAFKIINKILNY